MLKVSKMITSEEVSKTASSTLDARRQILITLKCRWGIQELLTITRQLLRSNGTI